MIPAFGIVGASVATVITGCLTTFIGPAMFRDTRRFTVLFFEGLFLRKVELRRCAAMAKEMVLSKVGKDRNR